MIAVIGGSRWIVWHIVTIIYLLIPASSWSAPFVSPKPLSRKESSALKRLRFDPHPETLTRQMHFITSDEKRHDYFRKSIENLGGVLVGVGTDQNYTLAAWARSKILILMDFDDLIPSLHRAYRVAFLNARTPQAFLNMFSPAKQEIMVKLLKAEYKKEKQRKRSVWAYTYSRKKIFERLPRVRDRYTALGVPTFLNNQRHYRYITTLYRSGRVFMVRGDLTGDKTMRDIARILKQLNRTVRVFYISNCEQYFEFDELFRKNMRRLPVDNKSVLLRTRAWRGTTEDGKERINYTYITQPYENYRAWLKRTWVKNVHQLVPGHLLSEDNPHITLTEMPKDTHR
jgi:hypothetical protein